jgi:hypothetical protein
MISISIVNLIGLGIFCAFLGGLYGLWVHSRILTSVPDRDGVCGPEKIRGTFYYLVPEATWVRSIAARHWWPPRKSTPNQSPGG